MVRRLSLLTLSILLLWTGCSGPGVQTEPPPAHEDARTVRHTVAAGETLRAIALHYYGDPDHAAAIAAANGIADPERVLPGAVLVLHFDADQWDGARRRATALAAYNEGVQLMEQDRLAPAEKQFRLALDTWGDLHSASYNLALVLSRRGKHAQAVEVLDRICASEPGNPDFQFARGHALFSMTRFTEGAEAFAAVLEADPQNKRAVFSLARCLQESGRPADAMAAWERYLQLDDSSSWAATARRNLKKLRDAH